MGLTENIRSELAEDLPTREAVLISEDGTVGSAIELMRAKEIGCAFVVDDMRRPIGMFTERKLIELLAQGYEDLDELPLEEHLDEAWFAANLRDPLVSVIDTIQRRGARFVCLTDEEGRVVAVTGEKGLAEYVADHFPQQVMVQRVGGKPGLETREGA
jgi:CBS domain-containing protein